MDEAAVVEYITGAFAGVETEVADGNTFFFFGSDHKFPFVTLVTNDLYDTVSNLDRPGVFRLNIGVGKATFRALFGEQPPDGYDYAALDQLMPHPIYGKMYWVSVLSPSAATFAAAVRPLLAEAYDTAAGKQARKEARG